MRLVRLVMLAAGTAALFLVPAGASLALSAGQDKQEYGDAPDGRPTGYGPRGMFPSLERSDGARAADSSTVFLGKRANQEGNARLVNRDRFDDGVAVNLNSCKKSEAFIVVNRPDIKVPTGSKAYVNLFFDWNRNGKWAGNQRRCGRTRVGEWTVKNYEIDLAKQTTQQAVYRILFRAGRVPAAMWYRVLVTIDEPWQNARGAGAFPSGEVEDYLLGSPAKYRCVSRSLRHGKKKTFRIIGPGIVSSKLVRPIAGYRNEGLANNGTRRISRKRASRYEYVSKKVHFDGPPIVVERFKVLVNGTFRVTCTARVIHPDIGTPGGSGTPGNETLILKGFVHGPPEKIKGVEQAVVCANFKAAPGAKFEVSFFFTDSTSPFTTLTGEVGESGDVSARTNLPVGTGTVLRVEIDTTKGASSESVSRQITVGPAAESKECAFS